MTVYNVRHCFLCITLVNLTTDADLDVNTDTYANATGHANANAYSDYDAGGRRAKISDANKY